jgi:hypothetical protein
VVVISFWRRVIYHYKIREPWRELLAGPAPAEKSILLDYISLSEPSTIKRALKHRHYSIATAVAVFFLLKIILSVSTTLFVVKETDFSREIKVTFQDAFAATSAWSAYHPYKPPPPTFPDPIQVEPGVPVFSGGSGLSVWKYLGKLNNMTDSDVNWQLPDNVVTSKFALPSTESNVTRLESPVDVFMPKVVCEEASLSTQLFTSDNVSSTINFYLTSKACSNVSVPADLCVSRVSSLSDLGENPVACKLYTVNQFQCANTSEPQYAITTAEYEVTYKGEIQNSWHLESVRLLKSAGLICDIGYGIATNNARLDLKTGRVSFSGPVSEAKADALKNLSSNALAQMIWTNLLRTTPTLVVDPKLPTRPVSPAAFEKNLPGAASSFFQIMYAQLGNPGTLNPFYDAALLKNATVSVLNGLALKFAQQSLLTPQSSERYVKGWVTENRLHMRHPALWLMLSTFGLLALLCLLLILQTENLPWNPAMSGSIAGNAAILSKSPTIQAILSGSGHLTTRSLSEKLAEIQFTWRTAPTDGIELQAHGSSTSPSPNARVRNWERTIPWSPRTARLPTLMAIFAAPAVSIGVLEFLYRRLRQKDHLFLVGTEDSTALSYVTRIASTVVVLGVASLINKLDFWILVFAPYSNLRSGNVPADRSILLHLLAFHPLVVMFKSLRHAQVGPAASKFATFIAAFLAVAVSGLWISSATVVTNRPITVNINNWDRTWFSNATDDGGAGIALNLIRHNGASAPEGIREDLNVVVPDVLQISADTTLTRGAYRGVNYTYNVLALEPTLNCVSVPQDAIETNRWSGPIKGPGRIGILPFVTVTVQPPGIDERCSLSSSDGAGNFTFGIHENDFALGNTMWIGQYYDLSESTAGQVPIDCPSIGILFGSLPAGRATERNLTALLCSQKINQVPVQVDYSASSGLQRINNVRKQGRPISVWKTTNESRNVGYKLHTFMQSSFLSFEDAIPDPETTLYDRFFNHLLFRPNHSERAELTGPANVDKLIRAITEDYVAYARHFIDCRLRATDQTPVTHLLSAVNGTQPSAPHSDINATYSAEVTHLELQRTSKLILQILLSAMTTLSAVGFILVKIRGTLPRDPCSIGSSMALLVDSQLCDRDSGVIPEGAQYMSEKELRNTFDGWVFSLGWWDTERSIVETTALKNPRYSDNARRSRVGAPRTSTAAIIETKRYGVDIGNAGI